MIELDNVRINLDKTDNKINILDVKFNWHQAGFQERRNYIEGNVMKILVGNDVKIFVR